MKRSLVYVAAGVSGLLFLVNLATFAIPLHVEAPYAPLWAFLFALATVALLNLAALMD